MNQTLIRLLNQYDCIACCYWILTLFALGEYGADAICEVRCVSLFGLCWRDVDVEYEGARSADHHGVGHQDASDARRHGAGRRQKKLVRFYGSRRKQKICWERVGPPIGIGQPEMGFRLCEWETSANFSEICLATCSRVHYPRSSQKVTDYGHNSCCEQTDAGG